MMVNDRSEMCLLYNKVVCDCLSVPSYPRKFFMYGAEILYACLGGP